jgi:MSHA pilin protein MshA
MERDRRQPHRGFTLIELVAVILILGVIAAFALPRFTDVASDAGAAAVRSLSAAVREAATNWRLLCAAKGASTCNVTSGTYNITNSGQTIQIWDGWPDAGDRIGVNEIDMAVNARGFTVVITSGRNTIWRLTAARDPLTCFVQYTKAIVAGSDPVVTFTTTGC